MSKRMYRSMWMGLLMACGLVSSVQAELVASWRFDDAANPLKATVGEDAVVGYAAKKGSAVQNGATINLAGKTDAWTLPKATGKCTDLRFADGAAIGLAFGSRKLGTNEKVLAWPADNPPPNIGTLRFRPVDRGGSLKRRADGVYFVSGLTLILR